MGWLRAAVQANQAMEHGRAHGLTQDEAREVLGAWIEYNLLTGTAWSHLRVRQAMDARADGQDWRPPSV